MAKEIKSESVPVTVRLPQELIDKLDLQAGRENRTRSNMARTIIEDALFPVRDAMTMQTSAPKKLYEGEQARRRG